MTAADYPVTFGYKAQDGYYYGPNGKVGPYHRGNDRACPTGTPIVIAGTTIGLTGATGIVSGPHLHTQACPAGTNYATDIDPTPHEFKAGEVVIAGMHPQFGNRIVIRANGVDLTYAHLSKINVQVGQKVGDIVIETSPPVFDADFYLRMYPDVLAATPAGMDAKEFAARHWLISGINEGRISNEHFAVLEYKANYPDLQKAFGTNNLAYVKHWYTNGIAEGRSGRTIHPDPAIADLKNQVAALTAQVTDLTKVIGVKDGVIADQTNQINSLKSQVGDNTKWQTLRALLRELLGIN